MPRSGLREGSGADGGCAAQDGNPIVRFILLPPGSVGGLHAEPARPVPSPAITYGCVDWFDYKNHPLEARGSERR